MTISKEMREAVHAHVTGQYLLSMGAGYRLDDAVDDVLDALAAMPEAGCEGCERVGKLTSAIIQMRIRASGWPYEWAREIASIGFKALDPDHYTPKEARDE